MSKIEENDENLSISNEILLIQIKQSLKRCRNTVWPTKRNLSANLSKKIGVFLVLLFIFSSSLIALPILVQSIVNGSRNGATVGTFNGGTNQLISIANLSVFGHTRSYVAQYFVPTASGTYDIGLSASSEDTVLILYTGNFDPNNPGTNGTAVIDDYVGARPPGISVASGSCGSSDPNGSFCPQITANLLGGQTYFIVVTSYAPNMTVSDGVNMYVYGSPVLIGNSAQENGKKTIARLLRLSLSDVLINLREANEKFMDGAAKRHSANISQSEREDKSTDKFLSSMAESNKQLSLKDKALEISWSKKSAHKKSATTSFIIESFVEHKSRGGIQEHTDVNIKAAREIYSQENNTSGISFALQSTGQTLSEYDKAEFKHNNLLIGAYSTHSSRSDLLLQVHASAGLGRGMQSLNSNSLIFDTKFDTKTFLIGSSIVGKIDVNPYKNSISKIKMEIWPTVSFEHGLIKASDLDVDFKYEAIGEDLRVVGQKATVTSLALTPQFLFTNGLHPSAKTVSFAPRLGCSRVFATGVDKN